MSKVIDSNRLLDSLETRISEAKTKIDNWLDMQYQLGNIKQSLEDLKHEIERGDYDRE